MQSTLNGGKFLFLEPFFGGSHREFARGLARHSRHRVDLMSMSDRFWRWRMGGAALHFVRRLPDLDRYDGVVVSGLMSLADLKALAPRPFPPAMVYFHENQLTYPLSEGQTHDVAAAWTNVTTALAADRVVFNSCFHRDAFFEALPGLIRLMPDYRPGWVVDAIRERSSVLYPGCRFPEERGDLMPLESKAPPLVVWNHRWEYDKDPDAFFSSLDRLMSRGLDFEIALLGERYGRIPEVFRTARDRYGSRIVQYGFVRSREQYMDWLKRGTVVVSTALQENFGIAVVEAVRCGCIPVLPRRLSYPELIPGEVHEMCLYDGPDDLDGKLARLLTDPATWEPLRECTSNSMGRFSWDRQVRLYDRMLDGLAHSRA